MIVKIEQGQSDTYRYKSSDDIILSHRAHKAHGVVDSLKKGNTIQSIFFMNEVNCDNAYIIVWTFSDEDLKNEKLYIRAVCVEDVIYLTTGNIYLMNDEGKTVDKVID